MKHTMRRLMSLLLCAVMVATMIPMMASTAVSAAEASAPMLAYVPLDNRPVVYQRVEMAAGAAGFDIHVPEESLFSTKLDGQGGTGVNGSQHGDGAAIMNWLEEKEAAGCNYYIIHLDQMLSGGLVGSRHPDSQTITSQELDIIDRLIALANDSENKVYFIDIVMRLASTGSYKGYESAQYNALREWGAKDRYVMSTSPFSTTDYNTSVGLIDQIHSNYRKDPNGSTIAYDTSALTSANVNEYLAFRKRKLTLMNLVMQYVPKGTTYLVGVDDSSPNKNIQWNELMFLDKRAAALGLDYTRMSDTDSIGLMAVARCINDMNGISPKVRVRYYGNKADATDDYGNDTLRQNVDKHIECLNATSVSSGGEIEVLILTQPDSSYKDASYTTAINNLVAKAKSNVNSNVPTIVIEVSEVYGNAWGDGYTNLQDELLENVEIGKLMGYSNWNTVGNSIGIALGMGVSRYTYLEYDANITKVSHDWHLKSLAYAFVKDISYNARNKLNSWVPGADNGFNYWLDKTAGWKTNNHYGNIDAYDGATDGKVTAGRNYINTVLEAFMRGNAGAYDTTDYKKFNGNADQIVDLLKSSKIYTDLSPSTAVEIEDVKLSGFRFPWDRMFEIYFDVEPRVAGNVYYTKNDSYVYKVPADQTMMQFSQKVKAQYFASTVAVRDADGFVLSNEQKVATGYPTTLTINGTTKTYQVIVTGDVNCDAYLNTTDVRQAMQKTLGVVTFSDVQTMAADVDENGRVSSTDARRMLQLTLQ
ncbi:MAG: DUF4127 family protein [Clostridia bacterium]|nr:DUF4127 family protein [Clostridia bacterium]